MSKWTNPPLFSFALMINTIVRNWTYTLMPLTNADTKVGMKVLVTMTPAHPNWWDADRKPYECWLPELKKVGMKGDQVRY